ncbi:MAG: glycosyltransferase family 4 protein [Solirubrobacteraceae bacterium]
MRVLIDYRAALRQRTGVGEYTHQLVAALLAAYPPEGDDPPLALTLFSSSWKDRLALDPAFAGAAAVDRRVPVRVLNFAWHRLGWPTVETLTGGRFDVTHALHPLRLPSRAAAAVVTVHDLHFLAHPEQSHAEIRRDYPALVRRHARRADHIVVPSRFTASQVERVLGVPPRQISVCSPGAPAWPPRHAIPPDGYVLCFGTLEPRKNVGALLDAYETLLERGRAVPPLVLAGRATGAARPWLDRIARPPLDRVARHIGYVDPDRRRELYDGARLLVQPSHEEGFGIPVLEAMTVGVPVVAANRGALPEVLGDAGTLVDPANREELAAAIERMVTDDAFAGACVSKGVTRARHFSWDRTARLVYRAYELAIEHRLCASA